MDIKLIAVVLRYLGIPVYFLGIIENYGTWKGGVLFVIAAFYGVARLIAFISREWDAKVHRKIRIDNERIDLENRRKRQKEEN